MYQIRFYYKNEDKNYNKDVVYHIYNCFKTFDEACNSLRDLIKFYSSINADEVVFAYNFPVRKIEAYTLFLNKKGKDFVTIVDTQYK